MSKILIAEDERSMREILAIVLKKEGHDVTLCENGKVAIEALKKEIFDLIITDLKMPGENGLSVLKASRELSPDTIVIMITAFGTTEIAIEAMKAGAYDYITKPFKVDEIKLIIEKALERKRLKEETTLLKREIESKYGFENIIGTSPPMQKVFILIRKIAATSGNVLITGESGTGKELVARAIHNLGPRKERPFVTVNCGALPETLLESELFGHMKGSFTGAISNKEGLFEVANGGTILLDEISETSLVLQVKLLRAIEDHTFKRVGGTSDIKVDVRVIAATNIDLREAVRDGRFREDLFYRLNVLPIHLPPLRERKEDIPLLANNFLKKFSKKDSKKISPQAMETLINCPWKGNVRELENAIERVVALTDRDMISTEDLPEEVKRPTLISEIVPLPVGTLTEVTDEGVDLDSVVEGFEKDLLLKALNKAKGVKTDAARLLKISFRSFRHRLKKYGIP
jgi:two-component system response regulator PilR (NtrC family)